jgi:thioredoxin-related protein
MRPLLLLLLFSLAGLSLQAQENPESAELILKEASSVAAKEHKNVLVIFRASWCGWCRRMEASINDETCKDFFYRNYVITYLTVYESSNKKNLENPGALALLTKYKGNDQGIPYWMVFDPQGNLIGDSQITPGVNSGCPAKKEEVEHLIQVLRKSSTISEKEVNAVETRFRANND